VNDTENEEFEMDEIQEDKDIADIVEEFGAEEVGE
jgi:hypothetical protein